MKKSMFLLFGALLIMLFVLSACAGNKVQSLYKIPLRGSKTVNPYFINLQWIDFLRNNKPNQACADWIRLYIAKLNYPDKYKLTGTIDDFSIDSSGTWTNLGVYNSADSYAASFLILVRDYLQKGGEIEFSDDDIDRMDDITWVLLILQNQDGTVKAMPDSEICYLMNNCEDLAAFYAYLDLASVLPLEKKEEVQIACVSLYKALNTLWKDEDKYFWAISGKENWQADPNMIYPDRLAQLYPIAYGCLSQQPLTELHLWKQFSLPVEEAEMKLSKEQMLIYNWAKEAVQ